MFKDVDLFAGLAAVAFAITQASLAQQGIYPLAVLEESGFGIGYGTALAFGLAALGRWYNRHRKKGPGTGLEDTALGKPDVPAQADVDTQDGGSDDAR